MHRIAVENSAVVLEEMMKLMIAIAMTISVLTFAGCMLEDRYESEVDKDARWGDAEARANQNMGYREAPSTGIQFPDTLQFVAKPTLQDRYEDMYQHGLQYASGEGVAPDAAKAFQCFLEASARGWHAKAQYELAKCYKNGKGTKKNLEEAYYWMSLAAQQGNQDAVRECASMQGYVSDKIQARVRQRIREAEE